MAYVIVSAGLPLRGASWAAPERVPPLPDGAVSLFEETACSEATAVGSVAHVAANPTLTAGLLGVANCAFFGPARPVRSVLEAVSELGTDNFRAIVLAVAAAQTLQREWPLGPFPFHAHWYHSAAVACATMDIASTLMPESASLGFAAGLLHDVGLLVIAGSAPDAHAACLRLGYEQQVPLASAERRLLSTDHAEVGGWAAASWGVSEPLVEAIRHHHAPAEAPQHAALAAAVNVADAVAHGSGAPGCHTTHSLTADPEVWRLLGGLIAGMLPAELTRYAFYLRNRAEKADDLARALAAAHVLPTPAALGSPPNAAGDW